MWCDATHEAALIDPGGDLDRLLASVAERGLNLTQIWLTHAHIDHAGGAGELAETRGLPITGPHPGDQFWIDGLPQQSAMFGFPPARAFKPTRWLGDGDTVQIGNETLQVRHCPATRRAMWCSTLRRSSAASWATCYSPAASAARTFPRATTSS